MRWTSVSLATLSALTFASFPLLRPWGDKSGDAVETAAAFADPAWVMAHSAGMVGWVTLAAAVAVGAGRSRTRRTAAWLIGVGVAGILPYYGGENFGVWGSRRTVARQGECLPEGKGHQWESIGSSRLNTVRKR